MADITSLQTYKLYIHPAYIRELRKDIWSDEPVIGKLTVNKKKFDIDIAYRGSHIRKLPKRSYHISFYKPRKYRGAKELHLNAEYNDPSILRNKLSLDFFSEIGVLAPKAQHILLKLNGRTEGVYLELESVDEHFLTNRKLPDGAIYYAVDGDANFSLMSDLDKDTKQSLDLGYERKYGTSEDDYHLQKMIFDLNTISNATFKEEITKHIDVEKYLRWLAGAVFTQNYDGFVHNYALYRNGDTGLFEIIPWDYDATWGRDVNGEFMDEDYVPIEGFNTMTARILEVDDFRKQYKKLLEDIMDHQFSLEFIQPKIQQLHNLIRPFVLEDPYIKDKIEKFDQEPQFIYEYIEARQNYLKSKLYKLD